MNTSYLLFETKKTIDQLLKEPIYTKTKKLTSDLQIYFNFMDKLKANPKAKSYYDSIFDMLDFDSIVEGENIENVVKKFKNIVNSRKYEFSGVTSSQSILLNKFINNNFFNISDDLHSYQLPEDTGRKSNPITTDNINTIMSLLFQIKESIKKTTKTENKNISSKLNKNVLLIVHNLLKKIINQMGYTEALQSVKDCSEAVDILSLKLEDITVEAIPLSDNKKEFIKVVKTNEGEGRLLVSSLVKGYIKSNFELINNKPVKREIPLTKENISNVDTKVTQKDLNTKTNQGELELSSSKEITGKYKNTFNILVDQLIDSKNYPYGSIEAIELEDEWIQKFNDANNDEEKEKQVVNELTNIIHSTNNPTTEHEIKPTVTELPKDELTHQPTSNISSMDELGGIVDEPENKSDTDTNSTPKDIKDSIKCKSDYNYNFNGINAQFESGKTYSLLGTSEVPKKDGTGNILFYNIVAENGRQIKVPSWEVKKYFITPADTSQYSEPKIPKEIASIPTEKNKAVSGPGTQTGTGQASEIKSELTSERESAEKIYKDNELEKTLSKLSRFVGHGDTLNPHAIQEFFWKKVKNGDKGFTGMYDGTPFMNNHLTLVNFCKRIIKQKNITKSEVKLFKELAKNYTLTCMGSIVSNEYFKNHINELKPITASTAWAKNSKTNPNEGLLGKLERWKNKFLGESDELSLANSEYAQIKLISESQKYLKELKIKSLKESLDSLDKFNSKFNKLF